MANGIELHFGEVRIVLPTTISDERIGTWSSIIRRRYERGSVIVTSNRAVQEWPPLFKDELLASAAMDRLLHHAHVIEIDGDSYRNPPRGKGRRGAA